MSNYEIDYPLVQLIEYIQAQAILCSADIKWW